MNTTAEKIIKSLNLEPLEMEGGYFRRTHTSPESADFNLSSGKVVRPTSSAIYYLLTAETHSKIHRLPIDEVYHFYLGDPVELLLLENDGNANLIEIGNDVLDNAQPQYVVPKNIWQGSRLKPGGEFALLGTTMAPAFDYSDFEVPEDLEELLNEYPAQYSALIQALF